MKKILLANLGNRNVTLQAKEYSAWKAPVSFREFTKDLSERIEEILPEIGEQILTRLFEENYFNPHEVEKIVLFASDQINEEKIDQDTVHEALILSHFFFKKYSIPVETRICKERVTDNDALLKYYRNQFIEFMTLGGYDLVICDTGGTAQQKTALKIAAEFILPAEQFIIYNVNKDGPVEIVRQVEYRRIIDEEQIAALVQHGQFAAGLTIFESLPAEVHSPVVGKLLRIGALRMEFFWSEAQRLIESAWKQLPNFDFLSQFKKETVAAGYENFSNDFPNKNRFFKIAERFEIADFHYLNRNYSQAVLGYSIFLESFLNEFIRNASQFDLVGNYASQARRLASSVNQSGELQGFFGGAVQPGVPLHIKFAQTLTEPDGPTQVLLREFEQINSVTNRTKKGLDELRNGMAHTGKSIDAKLLTANVPDFSGVLARTRQLLGLPPQNSFLQLSRLIQSELRR